MSAVRPGPAEPGSAKHRAVVETSADGFWMVDMAGRILDVNDAYVRLSGYTREELLGTRIADLEANESPEDVAAHVAQMVRTGGDLFRSAHRCKDGRVRQVEVKTSYWPIEDGRVFAFIRDLSTVRPSDALLDARLRLSELSRTGTLDAVLQLALDEAERFTGSSIGFFHFVEDDQETLALQTWSTNTLASMCTAEGRGSHYPIEKAGVWADCARLRVPVVHNDYASLPDRKGLPEGHAPVVRELTVPVLHGGAVRAILGVGNKKTDYVAEDVAVLTELARLATDVVERKRAEEAFRESQARYQSLVENSPDALLVHRDGRIVFVNAAALGLFGATEPGQLVGQHLADRVHPVSRPVLERRQQLWREGADVPTEEETLLRLDGSTVTVEVSAARISLNGRQAIQSVARDVTERRRLDAQLREERESFMKIFSAAPIGLLLLDGQGTIRKANRAIAEMVNLAEEEIVGLRPGAALHCVHVCEDPRGCGFSASCSRCVLRAGMTEALSGRVPPPGRDVELSRLVGEKVETRFVNVNVEPLTLGGEPFAIAALEDVTDRKLAENAVRESERALQDAQVLARMGSYVYDFVRDRWSASPGLVDLLGVDRRWDGSLAACLGLIHPSEREDAEIYFRRVVMEQGRLDSEWRVVRPSDGAERWIHALGLVEFGPDGTPLRLRGSVQDVTKRKRDEERVRQAAVVFSSSREGFVITDRDANVLAVNEAFSRITGYSEPEAVGRNLRFLASGRHEPAFYRAMWHELLWSGYWQGEIWNKRKDGSVFPEWLSISALRDETEHVTGFVGVFSDASKVKATEERLQHLATHDALTDLPNRVLLGSNLEHAIARSRRTGSCCAVLSLDLDRFKLVNESLGFAAGDELLRLASRRLRECVRESETVARIGGDEFVVLLEDLAEPEQAAVVAQALIEAFRKPFALGGGRGVFVGLSVGIGVFPADGDQPEALLRNAGSALDSARGHGPDTFRFYSEAMTAAASEHVSLEADLRRGLASGEILVHYQPVVSLREGRIESVEALARWQSAERGLVLPDQFIPIAERIGLIAQLGEEVLRLACRQMKAWIDDGLPVQRVAVNLSPLQLALQDLPARVLAVLEETGLPHDRLEVEITETSIMERGAEAEATLRALKDLGIRLTIDDFGTGFSSLANLRRFPIDAFKIDRSFIRDLPGDAIQRDVVTTMLSLARHLGLGVVAEGVETEEQAKFLTWSACTYAQGFLYGRPVPAAELAGRMAASPA